ncbi:MAG: FG-GAP-like repeat-containing protein, partial [Bacteroidota bacterium]|nr:FG-GAP-like repeat-containing protein [Bacteroidota bacterium]
MKKPFILLLTCFCISMFSGCRNKSGSTAEKSTDLITIRTLGLAYLEEFKLDEAEKEFLRFIELSPKEKLGYANLGLTYLRMGKYPEAEKTLFKAIRIDPKDPDTRLILATVYQMQEDPEKAISQLKEALIYSPDHIKTLYNLTEIYANRPDEASQKERAEYLQKLVEKAPGNIVPQLNLTEMYIRSGDSDKAIGQMEIIRKQFPEFPKEALDYYNKTVSTLQKGDKTDLVSNFMIFENYLKVTAPYQAGMMDLKGPGGSLIGFPLITFDQQSLFKSVPNESILEAMKFSYVSSSAGLDIIKETGNPGYAITGDYDGDGDIDIYACAYDPGASSYRPYLFKNDMGSYKEVSSEAGIRHSGKESYASFSDFNNDGFLDLYIVRDEGDLLYRNTGKGTFENVTTSSKISIRPGGKKCLFFDADHDGDLDLFEMTAGKNLLFRNNADGTFTEQAERLGLQGNAPGKDAVFGDFDDDGDIDLFVVNDGSGNVLYSNQRQGIFKDVTEECGLISEAGSDAVAAGDYDNDGYLDLLVISSGKGTRQLYHNLRNGKFEKNTGADEMFRVMKDVSLNDAAFIDFDNDGFLDICFAGEPAEKDGRGLFLFHNDTKGGFTNKSDLLPEEIRSGRQIALMDYNDDGDIDMVVSGLKGGLYLLRNDGGNANHFINMKLIGLRAGSAKNNYFGIGAKVELRSGDLYQTKVVTDPNLHFGIGNRSKADVIRITWTNGVPQNIFFPETDQSLIEAQMLKGSCPFLYTWDGNEYTFVKDIMWRSALGMPAGIMGGTTVYAFPDASDDYLKISGEKLKAKDGAYNVQVTSELWETIYLDKLQLVAVDHPDSSDIFVAEQFTPPPFPEFRIYSVTSKHFPVSAIDGEGKDLLPFILEKDDKYIGGFRPAKYQGITEMHDLILDPGDAANSTRLYLFLNGWIFPTDASINVAVSQSSDIKVVSPIIQVIDEKGDWKTISENTGFPMGKDKTVIVDLSGKFRSKDHRIRIRTNMEIYWDQVFFSDCSSGAPVVSNVIEPAAADLHYRGFSKGYRKGGRYVPHWFDYSIVSNEPVWRDLTGSYTRYGDVLPLLKESDNKYIISNAGDETTVSFPEGSLPALQQGWKRDFLIRSVGWVKDGDLNTAFGKTVLPLPFHGMKSYPPSITDKYP